MSYITLAGVDGNAFSVMGFVQRHMKKAGYTQEEIADYLQRAKSSDYDNLLMVSMEQVDEINERNGAEDDDDW